MISDNRIKAIIRLYKRNKLLKPDTHIRDCVNQRNLGRAIFQAARAVNDMREKHPHQYLIKNEILELFAITLSQNVANFHYVQKFEDLIDLVQLHVQQRRALRGIGELAIYDTAVRIGGYMKIYPTVIYLHRGTRIGLRNLLGTQIHGKTIDQDKLPNPLQNPSVSPQEIEDILCIYKDEF